MYNKIFEELINVATEESDLFYQGKEMVNPNPFYIGFGNPNSKLLIIGQEKAIDSKTEYGKLQMKVESIDNPYQWKRLNDEKISDLYYKFDNPTHFNNPRFPYNGKPPRGNTWNQYQLLANRIFPEIENKPNSFLNEAFISEVNHIVSNRKIGNERNPDRMNFMNHVFYKKFPMTIIAAGDYMNREEIENQYDVKFVDSSLSEPHRKLVIYENEMNKRVLINTRQFSNFFFNKEKRDTYFDKICKALLKYSG